MEQGNKGKGPNVFLVDLLKSNFGKHVQLEISQ